MLLLDLSMEIKEWYAQINKPEVVVAACLMRSKFSLSDPINKRLACIGSNTGNLLFFNAIESMIALDVIGYFDEHLLDNYKSLVTTELVWVRENVEAPKVLSEILAKHGNLAIVPISVGLQAPEYKSSFRLSPSMERLLFQISERAVIGVRGYYTAEILNGIGIQNFEVIGCPSVYQAPLFGNSLSKLLKPSAAAKVVANYATYYGKLSKFDSSVLNYFTRYCHGFVEQVKTSRQNVSYPSEQMAQWYDANARMFFDVPEWCHFMATFDFCLGARFHGNVVAVLAGTPALFLTCDSRTKEMVNFFGFPSVAIGDFSLELSPEAHANRLDYSKFIHAWPGLNAKFHQFLNRNGLALSAKYAESNKKFELAA